jgi:hypothetical protein
MHRSSPQTAVPEIRTRSMHTTSPSPAHHLTVAGAPPHCRHAHNTAAQPVKGNISQIKKNSASKKELTGIREQKFIYRVYETENLEL